MAWFRDGLTNPSCTGAPVSDARALRSDIAELMWEFCHRAPALAQRYCEATETGRYGGCAGYHGIRPLLYCAGRRTSFDIYLAAFAEPPTRIINESPRVLIAGSADFVVPAVVTRGLMHAARDPQVTVVDRCCTPLIMCKESAPRFGMHWNLVRSDVRDVLSPATYDLIVSDRLLGSITASDRPAVVSAWTQQLLPGGRVAATVSVCPEGEPSYGTDSSLRDAVTEFGHKRGTDGAENTDLTQLLQMVQEYARTRERHRVRCVEEVLRVFEECGLNTISRDVFRREPSSRRTLVRIVAEKPR